MRKAITTNPARLGLAVLGLSLALAACGGSGSTATTSGATTTTAGSSPTTTAAAQSTTTSVQAVEKVNANTATESEVTAALQAAGVANADRWAKEVVEYRPYDTSDPDLTHLRDELAKYNPGAGVVDQIVSALAL